MARYLARTCPKCKGYLGVVIPEGKPSIAVRAINGRCLRCGYRLAWTVIRWIVIRGKEIARKSLALTYRDH